MNDQYCIINTNIEMLCLIEKYFNYIFQFVVVIRNGKILNIKVEELVVGDVIDVKFGDRVLVDVRVIIVYGFKVCF